MHLQSIVIETLKNWQFCEKSEFCDIRFFKSPKCDHCDKNPNVSKVECDKSQVWHMWNCDFCDKRVFLNTTFYVIFVHCDSSISRTHITRPDYKERAKGYKSFDSSHDFRTQGARRAKRFLGVTVCSIIMGFSLTLLTRILLNGISHARMTLKGAKIDALLQPWNSTN